MSDAIEWDMDRAKLEINGVVVATLEGATNGVVKGGLLLEAEVKRISPIDIGTYRTSIRCDDPVVTENNVEVAIGSSMPYGPRLEYGYVGPDVLGREFHQRAQPHWRPVFDLNRQRVHDIVAEEVRKDLEANK